VFACFYSKNQDDYQQLKIPAMKLGSAFQKINFLRDIQADYQLLNRSYFPELNLSDFDDMSKKIIEEDIQREQLPNSCKMGVYLAYLYYQRLLNKICNVPAKRIMVERVRIANWQKFLLIINSYINCRLNQL
jgi:phytoene synthase